MDILFFIIYILIYVICAFLAVLIYYYIKILVPGKDNYDRKELVDLKTILLSEIENLFQGHDKVKEYTAIGLSTLAIVALSYFGAIYGEHYESYFFHSALFPVLFYVAIGFMKKNKMQQDFPEILKFIFKYDFSILTGLTLGILAKIIVVYGVYHVISFIWVLINAVLLFFLLVNRMIEKINKNDYKLLFRAKVSDN
jgi:hypothetical protein